MVNQYGAQRWVYSFANPLAKEKEIDIPEAYAGEISFTNEVVHVYAFSEKEARRNLSKWFGFKAGPLLGREPW